MIYNLLKTKKRDVLKWSKQNSSINIENLIIKNNNQHEDLISYLETKSYIFHSYIE